APGPAPRVRRGHGHVLPEPRGLSPRGVPQTSASRGRCRIRIRAPAQAARLAAVDRCRADAHHGPRHRAPPAPALRPQSITSLRSETPMRRCRLLLLALCAPAAATAQSELPRTHRPAPTVPAITPGDLMTRLYILSDDSMLGREAGTPGNVKGTDYIAAEIKRAGLVPAGDDGTYFQTIPLKTRTFDTTSTFTVAGVPLAAFTDYLPLVPRPLENPSLAIVFGGEVGDTATRITAEQAGGKLVVLRVRGGARGARALRAAGSAAGAGRGRRTACRARPRSPSLHSTVFPRKSWRSCAAHARCSTTTRPAPGHSAPRA